MTQRKSDRRTASGAREISFPQKREFAFFSPFFFAVQSANSCEIAAQTLRKNRRTTACAKDAEKARKICGFACGLAARKRWESSAKLKEKRLTDCGCKFMELRILKFDFAFFQGDGFTLFWPPLDTAFYRA